MKEGRGGERKGKGKVREFAHQKILGEREGREG